MPYYADWNDWLLNRPTEKTRIWCRTLPGIDEMTGKTGPSDIFFVILMMDGHLQSINKKPPQNAVAIFSWSPVVLQVEMVPEAAAFEAVSVVRPVWTFYGPAEVWVVCLDQHFWVYGILEQTSPERSAIVKVITDYRLDES